MKSPLPGRDRIAELSNYARYSNERPGLPSVQDIVHATAAMEDVLAHETPRTRHRDSKGKPGGLLRLSALPALIIPDTHARPALLERALRFVPPGKDVNILQLLSENQAYLISLGDIFHTESQQGMERWTGAIPEYKALWASSPVMDEEMSQALKAALILMRAKALFPDNVHWLKGNHENVTNSDTGGDHSFYKFAAEGEMTSSWFAKTYGIAVHSQWRQVELDLPICAVSDFFVASHAEPAFALKPKYIVECRSLPDVIEALTWTANGAALMGSVDSTIKSFRSLGVNPKAQWWGGHRPVEGRYATRQNGRYVQFHNPMSCRAAWLLPNRLPDPEQDIFDI